MSGLGHAAAKPCRPVVTRRLRAFYGVVMPHADVIADDTSSTHGTVNTHTTISSLLRRVSIAIGHNARRRRAEYRPLAPRRWLLDA